MRNNNQKVVRRLSSRSLKNNRMRNLFAVLAIALTCMLFTTLTSMGMGLMQVSQEETMREVGGTFHAGLKQATREQMEKVTADPRVARFSWNIFINTVDNVVKRSAELRVPQNEQELENSFIRLEEGHFPEAEDDLVIDTLAMDELGIEHAVGEMVTLSFSFQGETIEKKFRVCGWYEGDRVSQASQLYISQAYWEKLKGTLKDADFAAWLDEHPEDAGQGLYSVGLYFASTRHIEATVRSVIQDAGYEPETELAYGVNWAYMSSRTENMDLSTVVLLGAALLIVLITGYLIIYNIFQISVMNDIRFYGLLKTIGTTRRQIRAMVRRQALVLSAMGIPIGLAAGALIGKLLLPFSMQFLDFSGMEVELRIEPAMLVFGAVFSLGTVLVSCRKPAKIAGSVSPIEAIRYSEGGVKNRKKNSENGARVHKMALSNLGRNRKKTVFVILSLSFSVILFCVVMTALGSFRMDRYLESRMVGDVTVGSVNYTAGTDGSDGFDIDEGFLEQMDSQPGILSRQEMLTNRYSAAVSMDEEALGLYRRYDQEGRLRRDVDYLADELDRTLEKGALSTDIYGYDPELLEHLNVLEGTLDIEKFQQGGYVLVSPVIGDDTDTCLLYEPGDIISLQCVSENTVSRNILDDEGRIVAVEYENLEERQYEVMAVIGDAPYSMNMHIYSVNGIQLILSKQDLMADLAGYPFAVSYTLEEDALDGFIDAAACCTENDYPYMGYMTRTSLMDEFGGMISVIRTLGVAMCIVIAVIGVLNFINAILTGIISRKREFAILCSIGMTKKQLRQMLLEEGLYYVLISGAVSIIAGSLLSYLVLRALNEVILFFEYQYNFQAFLIMLPIFAVIAIAAPSAAYRRMDGESVIEQLRDTES